MSLTLRFAVTASAITLINTTLSGNTGSSTAYGAYYGQNATWTPTYSNLGDVGSFRGLADPGTTYGNLRVADPMFTGSWHLTAASPLVDAGDPSITDPDGSTSDIGAFGGPATW